MILWISTIFTNSKQHLYSPVEVEVGQYETKRNVSLQEDGERDEARERVLKGRKGRKGRRPLLIASLGEMGGG
jgi:hypothetical protein